MDFTQFDDATFGKILLYINNLDWAYILTLIALSYFVTRDGVLTKGNFGRIGWVNRIRPALLSIPEAWRVFILGITYGFFLKFLRNYHGKDWVENMFNSLVFAMVFHKLFLNKLLSKLDNKIFPQKP